MPRAAKEEYSDDESDDGSIDERDLIEATLPEPEPVQIKVSTLHRRYRRGLINLNPYYQRDVVWPAVRQSGLIDSIFNNFYIPPVIFQCRREIDPEDPKTRPTIYQTAIDGKQRLSSIIAFMAGKIPYKDPRGDVWWYPVQESSTKRGKILTQELKDKFDNWSLLCIEYTGLTSRQEEDLFARVQQGMALSNYEKQMASHTPWIALVKQLMAANRSLINLCVDTTRGRDFGNFANVVGMIFHHTKKHGHEALTLRVSQAALSRLINKMDFGPPSTKLSARLRLVFDIWSHIENDYPETFTNNWSTASLKKFSPIEFIATGVLIHVWLDERNNETLNADILAMRKWIRTGGKVVDLRANTGTWRFFWDFIQNVRKLRGEGQKPVRRIAPPAVPLETHTEGTAVPATSLTLASGPISVSLPKDSSAKKQASRPKTAPVAAESKAKPVPSAPAPAASAVPPKSTTEQRPVTSDVQPSRHPAEQAPIDKLPNAIGEEEDDEIFGATQPPPSTSFRDQTPVLQPSMQQNMAYQNLPPNFTPEMMAMWQQAHVAQSSSPAAAQQPLHQVPPGNYSYPAFPNQFPNAWSQMPMGTPPQNGQRSQVGPQFHQNGQNPQAGPQFHQNIQGTQVPQHFGQHGQNNPVAPQFQQAFPGYPMQQNGFPGHGYGIPWQQQQQQQMHMQQMQQMQHFPQETMNLNGSPAPAQDSDGSNSEQHKRKKIKILDGAEE